MYSGLVGGLPFVARAALLACVGGLAFIVRAFGGFLLDYAFATIASLCNSQPTNAGTSRSMVSYNIGCSTLART